MERRPRGRSAVAALTVAPRRGDVHWVEFPTRDPRGAEIEKARPLERSALNWNQASVIASEAKLSMRS